MVFSADGKRGSQYTIHLNEGGLHHTRCLGTFHLLNLWKTKVELRIKETGGSLERQRESFRVLLLVTCIKVRGGLTADLFCLQI